MRADLLVLPDVRDVACARSHQRPELLDLGLAHVQESGSDGRQRPLVQRCAVVVAVEFVPLEREVIERVRAVHEYLDPERAGHLHDVPHRHDLPREVRDVRDFDDFRLWRDGLPELLHDVGIARRRNLEGDLLEDDPLALHPLLPRRDHPAIVLVREQHLIATLQVEAEDHDLVGLARVADDGHFLRITAELLGEIAPRAFHARLEHAPHVLHGQLVRESQVTNHLLEHVRRRGADAAVVEVDHGAIRVECALDLGPVELVLREFRGRAVSRNGVGTEDLCERILAHHREGGATEGETANEGSATGHADLGTKWGNLFVICRVRARSPAPRSRRTRRVRLPDWPAPSTRPRRFALRRDGDRSAT